MPIPGTFVDPAVASLKWERYQDRGHCRTYKALTADGLLFAMVGREPNGNGTMLWHISISHRESSGLPDRCPTWDEMKHAKFTLVPEDVAMVLIFPRRSVPYVDEFPTCLHLWESEDKNIDDN